MPGAVLGSTRDAVSLAAGVIVRRLAAFANRRNDLCIFTPRQPKAGKSKYMDPHVAS
jgi:hypothetical protein